MRVQMAIDVKVHQRNHDASGTTTWLTNELVAFSLRGKALNRGAAEMKIALFGTGVVIQATVRILTIELGGVSRRNGYTARITEISNGDQARLDAWIEERSQALSRSTSRAKGAPGGRKKLGDALKSGLGRGRNEATPEPVVVKHVPTTSDPTDDLVLAPHVTMAGDGANMTVAWANWKSVTASWSESLEHGKLRVYLDDRHPPRNYSLNVQLCLPDGSVHVSLGRVAHSDGPTLYLDMTLKTSVKKALSRG
jgi:hypothetical protein